MWNGLGPKVAAHRGRELELGWQGDPKLETPRPPLVARAAAMPHAAAGLHPLDAAGRNNAGCAVRVHIAHAALGDVGKRGDAGMRVKPETLGSPEGRAVVEEIKEDERLQDLAEVRWAHQAGDGTVV